MTTDLPRLHTYEFTTRVDLYDTVVLLASKIRKPVDSLISDCILNYLGFVDLEGNVIPRDTISESADTRVFGEGWIGNETWKRLSPCLPPCARARKMSGVLNGILSVVSQGLSWLKLKKGNDCMCGPTCERYFKTWIENGAWDSIKKALLDNVSGANDLDWSRIEGGINDGR